MVQNAYFQADMEKCVILWSRIAEMFKTAEVLWKEYGILFKFEPHLVPDFPQFSPNSIFFVEIMNNDR